jgi:octaprenyl-diphosphate synthase
MFGNAASVLVGDFLYSRAFQMMVGVESMRVMQVLADATNIIAEGEVLQLLNCHNADVEVDDYLQVIRSRPPSCSRRDAARRHSGRRQPGG